MESWSKIIVRKANIICPAENFYCAGILMSEAFAKLRNTPPRITDDTRAQRRDPQTAAEKLSHKIAKRWRMNETRARMGSVYFEILSIWRETRVKQSRDGKAWLTWLFSYVSLVASKITPIFTESSLALDFLSYWHFVGTVKNISIFTKVTQIWPSFFNF